MPLRETPRPNDFQEAVDRFKQIKGRPDNGYSNAMQQLRNVLDGSDTEKIKDKYYPTWDIQDIEDLLTELDESLN